MVEPLVGLFSIEVDFSPSLNSRPRAQSPGRSTRPWNKYPVLKYVDNKPIGKSPDSTAQCLMLVRIEYLPCSLDAQHAHDGHPHPKRFRISVIPLRYSS